MNTQIKDHLESIFRAGLQAVDPYMLILNRFKLNGDVLTIAGGEHTLELDLRAYNEIVVLGCGKAAAPMARALEDVLGERLSRGLVCVKYGHTVNLNRIELKEAGHPVPDTNGMAAAVKMIDLAKTVTAESMVFVLSTGGGSALLPAPAPGLSLQDEAAVTELLLGCGADINAMNSVRKHLSQLKGGRLAQLLEGATVVNLALSDVAGDNLSTIASGWCAPDFSTYKDAVEILKDYGIWAKVPAKVTDYLQGGLEGRYPETPDSSAPCFEKVTGIILAGNGDCIRACSAKAAELGYFSCVLPRFHTGEAREVGRSLYALATDMDKNTPDNEKPLCLICGGEATVTLPEDHGAGGRAMEVALSFLVQLQKHDYGEIAFLTGATDGNDGPTDAAGAFVTEDIVAKVTIENLDPEAALNRHDSYNFFSQCNGLLLTGPTNTNVCDVGVIIIH